LGRSSTALHKSNRAPRINSQNGECRKRWVLRLFAANSLGTCVGTKVDTGRKSSERVGWKLLVAGYSLLADSCLLAACIVNSICPPSGTSRICRARSAWNRMTSSAETGFNDALEPDSLQTKGG
jgi:hypothetical protein